MMRRTAAALLLLAALGLFACTAPQANLPTSRAPSTAPPASQTSSETASFEATLPQMPSPSHWAPEVTNPWFPYVPGTTFTYKGVKDGQPTVDTYVVTGRKKSIAGVQATVIVNTLRTGSRLIEGTEDWYAQDDVGNVWYLGEATESFNSKEKLTGTTGSWQTGVRGARPGLYMPAEPRVGEAFYQEYLRGLAEDTYRIVSLDGTVTVPYGTYSNVMVTEERTVLEPDVVTLKYYVKGVGQVYETDVKGAIEYAKLVSITSR
jgi:hypothetical protein